MRYTNDLRLATDIGGTFTDTVLMGPDHSVLATAKTPTTPGNPTLGALDGARHVLEIAGAGWTAISGFIHGTTLATNALIEQRGACVATITTDGFRDILEIGYERRYSQYDINIEKPNLLVPRARAFTVPGRMAVDGSEIAPLDLSGLDELVANLSQNNVNAVAICLLHAYANPAHELALRDALTARLPGLSISLSHEVSPEAREFDRLCTTIANAYIQPLMSQYLSDFKDRFQAEGLTCPILMMTAGGGMTTLETAAQLPIRLVESGPAGGAILAARVAMQAGLEQILSFDMGGTTAKLCLIDNGQPQTSRRFEIARAERFIKGSGMPVRIPVIEMIEIGAGGGSIAGVDRLGRVQVGPQSAGSDPGPAGFDKGGDQPTVTDADILQGLIDIGSFAEGRLTINPDAARQAAMQHVGNPLELPCENAAAGISGIVDENMASAGRMHAVESGKDLAARTMIAFGGNGPLHATRVARRAGVSRILVPRDPGVGSAVGFLHAPVSFEIVRSRYALLDGMDIDGLNRFFGTMVQEATEVVRAGAPKGPINLRKTAFMRYRGQGHEIEINLPEQPLSSQDIAPLQAAFETEYSRQFSRAVPGMTIEILNWSVRVATRPAATIPTSQPTTRTAAQPTRYTEIFCEITNDWRKAALYERADLQPGHHLPGPALIIEPQTTTYVSADFNAQIDSAGNIILTRQETAP